VSTADLNPLTRFSDRVDDYVKYRPSYPPELIAHLRSHAGLGPQTVAADLGAGTGIFSKLLLDAGARVIAVEPNAAMRAAAERLLGSYPRFSAVDGTGERTGLPDQSTTLITCAQAFHWMDPAVARREFARISRPGAAWALIWNVAIVEDEFARGYERIKADFGTDFEKVRHENVEAEGRFDVLYGAGGWAKRDFPNHQDLDWEGLRGRLLSSSYAPKAGHPNHEPMLGALRELFERTQSGGHIRMNYRTELILGGAGVAAAA
jgi:SAM-dependent methyltransferase